MDEPMIRLLTFVIIATLIALYVIRLSKANRSPMEPSTAKPKSKIRMKKKPVRGDFWAQVYDTDSAEEARKIEKKFNDIGIQCLVYEQGKKDVYGDLLKHYGVSVPHDSINKAQAILAEITL